MALADQHVDTLPQPATAVRLVDCDVHPVPRSQEELEPYAPEEWRDRLFRRGRELPTNFSYYDPPDFLTPAPCARTRALPMAGRRAQIRTSRSSS